MRITVLGLGGVGGYVGALLADQYKNEEVTFVMRGERAARTREQGLLLKSDYRGTHLVHPAQVVESAEGLPVQDYVIVCVKNYSLEEVCRTLSGCVDDHTIVIPIMNGADPGDRVRQYLGKGLVLDSLIYIVAFRTPEEIVQQGNFAKVFIGKKNPSEAEQEKIAKAAELMAAAGVDCFVADDIEAAIWRKYILNCAYNVSTAYYNSPIGPIRADKARAEEYEKLVMRRMRSLWRRRFTWSRRILIILSGDSTMIMRRMPAVPCSAIWVRAESANWTPSVAISCRRGIAWEFRFL